MFKGRLFCEPIKQILFSAIIANIGARVHEKTQLIYKHGKRFLLQRKIIYLYQQTKINV